MPIDPKLSDILVCPLCKGKVIYVRESEELVCKFDKLAFPVRDNIPVMLESEARNLSLDDLNSIS